MSQPDLQTHAHLVHFNARLTALAHHHQMMMDLMTPAPLWRGLDDWWPLPGEFIFGPPVVSVLPEDIVLPDDQGT